MPQPYDVAVVGLGAMGSAAAYHLASRGLRVVGFDRFRPPHTHGSSHGESRIIREAYWEDPVYVPMVRRAYELWADLERASNARLFTPTGALFMGTPEGVMVPGCVRTAKEFGIRHRTLTVAEVRKEFPQFHPSSDMSAFYEYRAGALAPEACVDAHLKHAAQEGAHLRFDEPVKSWKPTKDSIRIVTSRGEYEARKVVFAGGAWMRELVTEPNLPLTVERQVLYWFEPKGARIEFGPDRMPIYAFEPLPEKLWYGFPDLGRGCKVALHHQGAPADPDRLDRNVKAAEVDEMRRQLANYAPNLNGKLVASDVCMYTNTPDFNYLIDFQPDDDRILLLSPCSGHGFKYASVVGEIAADLLINGKSRFDLGLFRLDRFTKATT